MKKGNVKKHQFYYAALCDQRRRVPQLASQLGLPSINVEELSSSFQQCEWQEEDKETSPPRLSRKTTASPTTSKEEPGYFIERSKQVQDFIEYNT